MLCVWRLCCLEGDSCHLVGGDGKPPGPLPSLGTRRQKAVLLPGHPVCESSHCTCGISSHCFPTALPLPRIGDAGFLKLSSFLEISHFSRFLGAKLYLRPSALISWMVELHRGNLSGTCMHGEGCWCVLVGYREPPAFCQEIAWGKLPFNS